MNQRTYIWKLALHGTATCVGAGLAVSYIIDKNGTYSLVAIGATLLNATEVIKTYKLRRLPLSENSPELESEPPEITFHNQSNPQS